MGRLRRMVELVQNSTGPLLRATSYQHLIWATQEGKGEV